jgi:hypothetical protein
MRWSRARACVDYGVHVKVSVCWYGIRMAGGLFTKDGWFVVHKLTLDATEYVSMVHASRAFSRLCYG